ncbi:MAG TPA: class I SAM-dependent methyltransferase [Anaerolineaceae bacterium]|nr:class I SAM-dependent methyltransferase [Anaerolineaceae bacterium]
MAEISSFKCPLCESENHKVFQELESFGLTVRYYECQTCGLVFQNPAESQAGDPEFYTRVYRQVYQHSEQPTPKDLRQQRLRAELACQFLRSSGIQQLGRTLDIGASSGLFLETLRENLGAEVVGVELGQAYREVAGSKGISMFESLEALEASAPKRFELVSLMHVLEHLNDPVERLVEIREELLKPDGYLLVEVPNLYAHDSFEIAHLTCFSPHTLRQTLAKAGYEVVRFQTHGLPRSKTLKLFLTVLVKPIHAPAAAFQMKAEHFVHIKRQTGMLWRKILSRILPKKSWLPLEDA